MDETGLDLDRVLDALRTARGRDFSYAEGEILGSMCTAPHPVATEAFRLFQETNLGDPAHFPGARSLEEDYLNQLLDLTDAPSTGKGLFLSGGTEANVVAVSAAVAAWRAKHPDAPVGSANIIVGETGHFSFEKAAKLAGITLRKAPVDDQMRVRPERLGSMIDEGTCLIVGIAGNTEFGAIDPIAELSHEAVRHGVPLHVDAALGGFILPFLPAGGRDVVAWDFHLPGVTSITMDPHKMGASTIPGGVLLVRDGAWLEAAAVDTPYVTTDSQASILGTRPGAGAAAAWAVAKHLGREGYRAQADRCLLDAAWFRSALGREGVALHPGDLNVVLIPCGDPLAVQDVLSDKGWRVNAVPRFGAVRIVVMPHVRREILEKFLPDLLEVLAAHPPTETPRGVDA